MPSDRASIFTALKRILKANAGTLAVTFDTPTRYCLEGKAGPATIAAWSGKVKRAMIPVAWAEVRPTRVTYHLMGIAGQPALLDGMSNELKSRMQGASCFNFQKHDDALFAELEEVTDRALRGFRKAQFIVD